MNNSRRSVVVKRPAGEDLPHQLVALYQTLKGVDSNETVEFDFSQLTRLYPMLTLPLAAYETTTGSKHQIFSDSVSNYADAIRYPGGVNNVSELERSKTYIPISVVERENPAVHTKLEWSFLRLVSDTILAAPGTLDAIFYPITELVTNIFDHSRSNRGWLLAQWYPTKDFLDLCIVDRGCGLAAAYKEELGQSLRDEDAIKRALRGVSTKKLKERGYGLRTSRNVVCRALGGSFVLMSGSAAYLSEGDDARITRLNNFSWQGVIIAYRMSKPAKSIDVYPYLE